MHGDVDPPNEKLLFDLTREHSFASRFAIDDRPRLRAFVAARSDDLEYDFEVRPNPSQGLLDQTRLRQRQFAPTRA
jgi:hypothetical protein